MSAITPVASGVSVFLIAPRVFGGFGKSEVEGRQREVKAKSKRLDDAPDAANLVVPEPVERKYQGVDLVPLRVVSREHVVRKAREPRVDLLGHVRKREPREVSLQNLHFAEDLRMEELKHRRIQEGHHRFDPHGGRGRNEDVRAVQA